MCVKPTLPHKHQKEIHCILDIYILAATDQGRSRLFLTGLFHNLNGFHFHHLFSLLFLHVEVFPSSALCPKSLSPRVTNTGKYGITPSKYSGLTVLIWTIKKRPTTTEEMNYLPISYSNQ